METKAFVSLQAEDWYRVWEEKMLSSSWSKDGEEWWDKRAEAFDRDMKESEYVELMLKRLDIKPNSTILDIGCGPGTLAVPLAKRARSVTALDISGKMLDFVSKNARNENLNNITCVKNRWEDMVVGRDIEPHDVVICSRAFPESNPEEALRQLDMAARHSVYITMWANRDEYETFYRQAYEAVGKDYYPPPDYIYIYNMLYAVGIFADIEFIHYTHFIQYPNIEDALRDWMWRIRPENDEQNRLLRAYLIDRLDRNDGSGYKLELKCHWAFIRWTKQEG